MIRGRARARLGFFALALSLAAIAHPTAARSQSSDSQATSPADTVAIPAAVGHVNDFANVMDDASRAKLESFLAQVQQKTGAEFAVMTVKTTGVDDPAQYKVKVFERWHLGKKGEDNGLLLLVALQERAAYFETGYGLEGVLPDGVESRIHREIMLPRFRQGDYAGAVTQGMLAAAAKVAEDKGVTLEWNGSELRYDESSGGRRPGLETVVLVFVIVVIIMNVMNRMRRYGGYRGGGGWWIGPMMGGGGWGGGFGGGGFGGGGGGGFGGFGGGSSGGGGGGGHW